jgi:hypothetical protein
LSIILVSDILVEDNMVGTDSARDGIVEDILVADNYVKVIWVVV